MHADVNGADVLLDDGNQTSPERAASVFIYSNKTVWPISAVACVARFPPRVTCIFH
jgi:hypothetical protein